MRRVIEQHVRPRVDGSVFLLGLEDSGVGNRDSKKEGCTGQEGWIGEFIGAGQGKMAKRAVAEMV